MSIKREKSGMTMNEIYRLVREIRYRAGLKEDDQTFGEADCLSQLLENLSVDIQMEDERGFLDRLKSSRESSKLG
jgi:hypothetical protein